MYELLNIKWGESTYGTESGPVTWSDDLDGLPVASGSNVNDLIGSLRAAFNAWEDVAALDFRETSGTVDIEVGYASFSADSTPLNDGAAGTASWTPTSFQLNEPVNVRIEFNADYSWSPFQDSDPSTVNFFAVALHEIGHVIGLDHVNDPSEIMNPVVSATELGDGDKAGAQAIYGLDDGDEPVDVDDGGGSFASSDGGGGGGGGVILGLLALVVGLFTGGLGAAGFLAAGRVAMDEENDDLHQDDQDHAHNHHVLENGDHLHVLFLPPLSDDDHGHAHDDHDEEEEIFLL